jgi:hypothetical protein
MQFEWQLINVNFLLMVNQYIGQHLQGQINLLSLGYWMKLVELQKLYCLTAVLRDIFLSKCLGTCNYRSEYTDLHQNWLTESDLNANNLTVLKSQQKLFVRRTWTEKKDQGTIILQTLNLLILAFFSANLSISFSISKDHASLFSIVYSRIQMTLRNTWAKITYL